LLFSSTLRTLVCVNITAFRLFYPRDGCPKVYSPHTCPPFLSLRCPDPPTSSDSFPAPCRAFSFCSLKEFLCVFSLSLRPRQLTPFCCLFRHFRHTCVDEGLTAQQFPPVSFPCAIDNLPLAFLDQMCSFFLCGAGVPVFFPHHLSALKTFCCSHSRCNALFSGGPTPPLRRAVFFFRGRFVLIRSFLFARRVFRSMLLGPKFFPGPKRRRYWWISLCPGVASTF